MQQEFIAPREKYSYANLAVIEHTQKVLKINNAVEYIRSVESQIRQALRSLDSLRQDMNTLFRAMTVESSLER